MIHLYFKPAPDKKAYLHFRWVGAKKSRINTMMMIKSDLSGYVQARIPAGSNEGIEFAVTAMKTFKFSRDELTFIKPGTYTVSQSKITEGAPRKR